MWTPAPESCEEEEFQVVQDILSLREYRRKWLWTHQSFEQLSDDELKKAREATSFKIVKEGEFAGIFEVDGIKVPGGLHEFLRAFSRMKHVCCSGPAGSFCYKRMQLLQSAFNRYQSMFREKEEDQKYHLGSDIYTVHKVDTHIHAAAAPRGGMIVNYVRDKIKNNKHDIVKKEVKNSDGSIKTAAKTLGDVCKENNIEAETISANFLKFQADSNLMKRFDRFNAKYNLAGVSAMRDIFLKFENDQDGEYFAEMLLQEMNSLYVAVFFKCFHFEI